MDLAFSLRMCVKRKQFINPIATISLCMLTFVSAHAGSPANSADDVASMGQIAIGEGAGGITDRAFVVASPNSIFEVQIRPGSFLNCGDQTETGIADADGRFQATMTCGVTLTETIVIPAASESATITVHY